MIFKKKNKENFLDFVPIAKVGFETNENTGFINLLIPRFKSEFAQKYLIPKKKSKFIKANLDEYGSFIYQSIDGKRDVLEISNLMKEKYGDQVEPVFDRVSKFLGNLFRYKFIEFQKIKNNFPHE